MRKSMLSVVTLALIGTAATWSQGAAWERTYAMTGSRSCVQTVEGGLGSAPDFVLSASASTRSAHFEGKLVLRSDGTGSLETRVLQIYNQRTAIGTQPMNVMTSTCAVRFGSNPDGSRWLDALDCWGPIEAGAGAGLEGGTITPERLSLIPSLDGSILLLSSVEPQIITTYSTNSAGGQDRFDRICGRTGTAILQR
ncbi:MAG: hypothetical protein HY900_38465 [Deltaproteobacteria bacterium]|nr:hypothetical protein [Deltaproteobacteria bacterium]